MMKRLVFVVLMLVAAFLTLAPTPTPEPPPPTEVPPTEIVEVTPTEVIEATPTVPGTLITPDNPPTPIPTLRPPHHDSNDDAEAEVVGEVAPKTGGDGDELWKWFLYGFLVIVGVIVFLRGLIKIITGR